jgi:hypothetical protein
MLNFGIRYGWVLNAELRPLYLRKEAPVSLVLEIGWVLVTVWVIIKKSLTPPEFEPRNLQYVVRV